MKYITDETGTLEIYEFNAICLNADSLTDSDGYKVFFTISVRGITGYPNVWQVIASHKSDSMEDSIITRNDYLNIVRKLAMTDCIESDYLVSNVWDLEDWF